MRQVPEHLVTGSDDVEQQCLFFDVDRGEAWLVRNDPFKVVDHVSEHDGLALRSRKGPSAAVNGLAGSSIAIGRRTGVGQHRHKLGHLRSKLTNQVAGRRVGIFDRVVQVGSSYHDRSVRDAPDPADDPIRVDDVIIAGSSAFLTLGLVVEIRKGPGALLQVGIEVAGHHRGGWS